MAKIAPFKALRYNTDKAGKIENLVCPPYDIISDTEYDELLKKSPYNMVKMELPKGENKYEVSAEFYRDALSKDILHRDEEDAIYIYEEEFIAYGETKKIKGFISLVKLEEFSKKVVLPHEETLSKAKTDRFNLMSATNCNFSQIYSLYNDENGDSAAIINKCSAGEPDVEFTSDDGIIHRLWIVTDKNTLSTLEGQFEDRQLFIADGHHRYETALKFKQKLIDDGVITDESHPGNFVMMMLVDLDNDGLVVFPTHRMIKDLDGFSEEKVLKDADKFFSVEKVSGTDLITKNLKAGEDEKTFAFYTGKDYYYLLTLKDKDAVKSVLPNMSGAYCNLDVSVLHTLLLQEAMGIDKENMASQKNLTYTRDIDEALKLVKSGEYQCSFILNPTKVREIKDVALAGEKMPQKSTYFYPKIITGLVINKIC